MTVIQTYKTELATGNPIYKNYYATCGLKSEIAILNSDRDNNDLTKFSPIKICDVFETDETIEAGKERLAILLANAIDLLRIDTNSQKEHEAWEEYVCHELGTNADELKKIGIEL